MSQQLRMPKLKKKVFLTSAVNLLETIFHYNRYNRRDIDEYEDDLPQHVGDVRLWDGREGWSGWRNNYWRDDYQTREQEQEDTGLLARNI